MLLTLNPHPRPNKPLHICACVLGRPPAGRAIHNLNMARPFSNIISKPYHAHWTGVIQSPSACSKQGSPVHASVHGPVLRPPFQRLPVMQLELHRPSLISRVLLPRLGLLSVTSRSQPLPAARPRSPPACVCVSASPISQTCPSSSCGRFPVNGEERQLSHWWQRMGNATKCVQVSAHPFRRCQRSDLSSDLGLSLFREWLPARQLFSPDGPFDETLHTRRERDALLFWCPS